MKPLFTIHAGELVAGDYIERTFRRVNVWVPAKDTGVDLLVSDAQNKKLVSLQVKFSRDFLATLMAAVFQKPLRACGWWSLNLPQNRDVSCRLLDFRRLRVRSPQYRLRDHQAS